MTMHGSTDSSSRGSIVPDGLILQGSFSKQFGNSCLHRLAWQDPNLASTGLASAKYRKWGSQPAWVVICTQDHKRTKQLSDPGISCSRGYTTTGTQPPPWLAGPTPTNQPLHTKSANIVLNIQLFDAKSS